MRPLSARVMPERRLRSVVLPAPFGPMIECTVPGATSRSTSRTACTPPKCLASFSARRIDDFLQRRHEAARHEDHGEHHHRAQQHHLVLLEHGEQLRKDGEHRRAEHRAEGGRHAAEHHHGDELDRMQERGLRRRDEARVVRGQRAGEGGERGGENERRELVARRVDADRAGGDLRGVQRAPGAAARRVDEVLREPDRHDEQHAHDPVPGFFPRDRPAEHGHRTHGHPIGSAVAADTLRYASPPAATDDEIRRGLAKILRLGLIRYVARTSVASRLEISYSAPARAAERVRDPWNYWVFRMRLNGNVQGEKSYKSQNLNGSLSARRVTEAWKISLSFNPGYNQNDYTVPVYDSAGTQIGTQTITTIRREYGANTLVARSLSPRWSVGFRTFAYTSTYTTQDLLLRIAPAIEFDFYPYSQSTRRLLTDRKST